MALVLLLEGNMGILMSVNEDSLGILDTKHGEYFLRMLVYDKKVDLTMK